MVFIWCTHFFPQFCVWPKMHFPYHYWQQCQIDIGKFSIIGFVRRCTASFIKDDNGVCLQAATLHYTNTTKYLQALSTFTRPFGVYRYALLTEIHKIQTISIRFLFGLGRFKRKIYHRKTIKGGSSAVGDRRKWSGETSPVAPWLICGPVIAKGSLYLSKFLRFKFKWQVFWWLQQSHRLMLFLWFIP